MNPNMASIAALISDPSRAAILTSLLDGRFHPASSLAYIAGIKPQTASFHLRKLHEADLLQVNQQGRHRYYGLKNHDVAKVLETFLLISPDTEMRSFKQVTQDKAIRYARTCYDHLAGNIGVKVTESMLSIGYLEDSKNSFVLTEKGEDFFNELQIDLAQIKKKRRKYIDKCLDWSERKYHISGAIGNALLVKFLELNWIRRVPDSRAIKITKLGERELKIMFGITLDDQF
ncbi:winged helix-turn-helix domain-containing protein [Bacillus carboniphilus]|uniref:Winged helix-turn-helix domain-containing protein n=1 Tax=Bacillus carboniphilus TaxID=86663 RepID=A0ABP3G869_9BACI